MAISALRASALAIFSVKWFKLEVVRDANKIKELDRTYLLPAIPR
jgi:hypothetical protein